eukprot:SAG31_NODE_43929_length_265_cov_0.614458_1_plen_26_part_01
MPGTTKLVEHHLTILVRNNGWSKNVD